MSNRAVSSTYRAIIDDVIANVRQDFEDMGIENEVLVELQRSWEAKTVTSGVADFEGAPPGTSAEEIRAARKASREEAAALKLAEEAKNNPKPEAESSNKKPKTSGTSKSESATASNANGGGENLGPGFINPSNLLNNATGSSSAIGGNSNSNSISSLLNNDNNSAETSAAGAAEKDGNGNGAGEKRKREENNQSDEIGSDLDDDDDEGEENLADVEGEDIGLCLYDKVQRVKNKWKCVLRDGIASVDGRDYLFSKCNGEFEW